MKLFTKLGLTRPVNFCNHNSHDDFDFQAPTPLQIIAREDAVPVLKFKLGTVWRGWKPFKDATNTWRQMRIKCSCGATLRLSHLIECEHQAPRKNKLERILGQPIQDILGQAKRTNLADRDEVKGVQVRC